MRKPFRRPLAGRHEAGMTIVEVVAASLVLVVVLAAVATAVYAGLRLQATSRQRATATAWADHLMELARNKHYAAIGLATTTSEMDAAVAAVPPADGDNPDLLVRRGAGDCLEFNTGTAASPAWERLVLADWHRSPAASAACSTEPVDPTSSSSTPGRSTTTSRRARRPSPTRAGCS